jgi:hypothetical protein
LRQVWHHFQNIERGRICTIVNGRLILCDYGL